MVTPLAPSATAAPPSGCSFGSLSMGRNNPSAQWNSSGHTILSRDTETRSPHPHPRVSLLSLHHPPLRLHLEQAGRPPDAALREGLHRDQGARRPSGGRRPLQIPLREAEDVGRRRNKEPLPGLRGSRGRNGEPGVLHRSRRRNE